MNKREFTIFSTAYSRGFSSFVTQYLKVDSNVRYLLYASEEKNHINIIRQDEAIASVDIKIGTAEMFGLLPDEQGAVFIDISEIIKANAGNAGIDMIIKVTQSNGTSTYSYKISVAEGRRFDELACYLSLPQSNFCNLGKLAIFTYNSQNSQSIINPPTRIILPLNEDGTWTKFKNIQNILLPIWSQNYGIQNTQIAQTGVGIISTVANKYSPISIAVADAKKGVAQLRIIGTLVNNIIFSGFDDAKKYIAIRWICPYIAPVEDGAQGTITPYQNISPVTGMAFFEVLEIKQATNVISLENTASYMPNLITEGLKIKIGLKNLNAYDYIYYSQILLSNNIEYCLAENFGASGSFTDNFQPAKVEKTNNIIPVGNGVYNLEITLTIKEND